MWAQPEMQPQVDLTDSVNVFLFIFLFFCASVATNLAMSCMSS